jgi:V/A-type H+-transporting ATPase subunit C
VLKDCIKIKKFLNQSDEKVLRALICRYETTYLKNIIRESMAGIQNLSAPPKEMIEIAEFDAVAASRAQSVEGIIKELEGSPYKEPIAALYQRGRTPSLFEIETTLDIYYFKRIWKTVSRYAAKSRIKEIIAQEADMLNLLWIYRCKKYYSISNEVIYALMLPVHRRLNPEKIRELIETEDFDSAAADIKYYDFIKNAGAANYEKELMKILTGLFAKINRAQPYSAAAPLEYIFAKRLEIENVLSIIEGVRYGLGSEKIMEYTVI